MRTVTLTPAYGRDYISAESAKSDFFCGKDFILNDIFDQYDGKPINLDQFTIVPTQVRIRYKNQTKVTTVILNRDTIEARIESGSATAAELASLAKFLDKFS